MTLPRCDVCNCLLPAAANLEVQAALLQAHGQQYHPDVLPWACETCFYVPPGVKGVRCTDIQDGVGCMMYKRRPEWLRF